MGKNRLHMINDGFNVLSLWPELKALLARLELPETHNTPNYERRLVGVKLKITVDFFFAKAIYRGETRNRAFPSVSVSKKASVANESGFSCWQWPEFQALINRLGVPQDVWHVGAKIRLFEGEMPEVTLKFKATDTLAELTEKVVN